MKQVKSYVQELSGYQAISQTQQKKPWLVLLFLPCSRSSLQSKEHHSAKKLPTLPRRQNEK